ncbi:hypothetical protein DYB32_004261 [Aphanomyces invadans]|uniref:Tyrosinase copper-binding domain-containing protein n=1 Tax=Aphanomyces invadans TaxID=157072 RepID=A0A3R6VMN7_9STRA|nr:hypothetical protein DYB32_004261 [Aphanomyces invadans]
MRAAVATLVLLAILVVGHAQRYQCKGETFRLRKPWSMLTATERARHIAAVGDAMSAGYHHRFVEMHTEPQSECEAHGCMFIYWHRKFLLGYENMLRSLKPEYACLTLPYWDYATLSSSFVSGMRRTRGHNVLIGPARFLNSSARHVVQQAEIDLMHRIYFKCVVADTVPGRVPVLSDSAKRSESDTRIWRSCVRYNETTIRSTDPVLMLAGQYNQVKIDVHNPSSPLYEFFKDLPRAYYKTATFLQSAGSSTNPSYVDRCVDRPRLACEVTEQSFLDYMSNVAGERGWSHDHLIAQVEALVCIHHHECLGGCADYSDEFKATFHPMGPPRCKVVVDRWKNGQLHIRVKNWRAILARFFPCAHDAAIANA